MRTIERERVDRRRERRERLERKQKRLAAVDQLTTSSETTVPGSELEDGSLAALRAQRSGGRQAADKEYVMVDEELDSKDDSLDDGQEQQRDKDEEDQLITTHVIAGDGQ